MRLDIRSPIQDTSHLRVEQVIRDKRLLRTVICKSPVSIGDEIHQQVEADGAMSGHPFLRRLHIVVASIALLFAAIRLISVFSGSSTASLSNQAIPLIDQGKFEQALQLLNQVIARDPSDFRALTNRGNAYVGMGQLDLALQDFTQALSLKPDEPTILSDRCNAHMRKGDLELAVQDCSKAIGINPKFVHAFVNRGAAYTKKGEYDHAIQDFGQAIRLDPTIAGAYIGRGVALFATDQYELARQDLDQGIRLKPDVPSQILSLRGQIEFFTGLYPSSRDDLRLAVRENQQDAYQVIWLHLADIRVGEDDQQELSDNAGGLTSKKWPRPVIDFYMNRITEKDMFAAAAIGDADAQRGQICEAHFYIGEYDLHQGLMDEAKRSFQAAVDGCPKDFIEAKAAVAELKSLP